MHWWAWIVIGAILLGSELAFVEAQFYLVFLGAAALVVGMLDLGGVPLPAWGQWLTFALLSVISMVLFRQRVYQLLRKEVPEMKSGPVGDSVVTPIDLAPGDICRVEYRGTTWEARNDGEQTLIAGSHARILRVDGLTLKISH
jgi:membrane protein implicated in regulation of membrane protease activity